MEEWKTIEPNVWKPEEDGDSIEGIVLHKTPADKDKEMSAKYYLDDGEGQVMIWGCATLDERMLSVKVSDRVKITFKEKKDIGKCRTLNIYKVEIAVKSKEPSTVEQPEQPEQPKEEVKEEPTTTVTQSGFGDITKPMMGQPEQKPS